MLRAYAVVLVVIHAALMINARPERRQLEHRKLFWAETEEDAIPDEYIVAFDADTNEPEIRSLIQTKLRGTKILKEYHSALHAVAVKRISIPMMRLLLSDPRVVYIEENRQFHEAVVEQGNPSWNLDRIDQTSMPLDGKYRYGPTGKGVEVYILDSGMRLSHNEYRGRARCGYNGFDDVVGEGCEDPRGHGTHVGGVVAGTVNGVAKDATLVAVTVLNDRGSGTLRSIMNGMEFVLDEKKARPGVPMVINFSISGSGRSTTLDGAVRDADLFGIIFVTSAGNGSRDACPFSPTAASQSISVAASSRSDTKPLFSNYGPCVDLFAPGDSIWAAGYGSDTAMLRKSGTSMASPSVAGAAALYLELHPTWKTEDVRSALIRDSSKGQLSLDPDENSPNRLLNIGNIVSIVATPRPTPVPVFPVGWLEPPAAPVVPVFPVGYKPLPPSLQVSAPTTKPTLKPTTSPTPIPTRPPTVQPTPSPTPSPTRIPTRLPTSSPTPRPTLRKSEPAEDEEEDEDMCAPLLKKCETSNDCCSIWSCHSSAYCWFWP